MADKRSLIAKFSPLIKCWDLYLFVAIIPGNKPTNLSNSEKYRETLFPICCKVMNFYLWLSRKFFGKYFSKKTSMKTVHEDTLKSRSKSNLSSCPWLFSLVCQEFSVKLTLSSSGHFITLKVSSNPLIQFLAAQGSNSKIHHMSNKQEAY